MESPSDIIIHDKGMAFLLVVHDGNFIKLCSPQLRDTLELWRAMLESEGGGDGSLLAKAGPDVLDNNDIAVLALPKGASLQIFSARIRADKYVVRYAVHCDPENFRYASGTLREDRKFLFDLLHENGAVIKYFPCILLNDPVLNLVAYRHMSTDDRKRVYNPWNVKHWEVSGQWQRGWRYAVSMPGCQPRREGWS